jgi:DNA invertase Pin-like site-specific DNA recombinase
MIFGYARVSTDDQTLEQQVAELIKAGVPRENIAEETMSGMRDDRPLFDQLVTRLHPGDTLYFWKLDRVARSFKHLITLVEDWAARGIKFRSLTQPEFQTESATGKLILRMIAAIGEFERDLIVERTKLALSYKKQTLHCGRPFKLSREEEAEVHALIGSGRTVPEIAKLTGLHRATIYRMQRRGANGRSKTEPERKPKEAA